MVTAGHSIDSVQGTSAGHRLPAMAFRWPALAHRSVCGTTLASGCPSLAFAGNRWPATRQRWEVFVEYCMHTGEPGAKAAAAGTKSLTLYFYYILL